MKGQRDQTGEKSVNGACGEEIDQREEMRGKKRGRVETKGHLKKRLTQWKSSEVAFMPLYNFNKGNTQKCNFEA